MIDPRISLGVQVPNSSKAIDIFENALMNSTNRGLVQAQEQRAQELAPFKLQQAQQGVDINTQTLSQNRDTQRLQNLHVTGQRLKPLIESGNIQAAQQFMLDNISGLQSRIESGENLDITESMETLAKLQAGDFQGVLGDINAVSGLVLGNKGTSAGQREFNNLLKIAQDPSSTKLERLSAERALGATAKVSTTVQERIADNEELAANVASTQAEIAGQKAAATEGEKLKQQLKHKPAITRAVKLAEKAATEQGDVLTDLARAKAGLPGLIEATSNLKELATAATSTYGGRLFDVIAKESGWGSTKGANARAKYIAIIDNQVLPLLKQTFGGAMTEGEGLRLSNTFGDPNATPEQKMLQTEAFIEQKQRDIKGLEAQAEAGAEVNDQIFNFDAQGNLIP